MATEFNAKAPAVGPQVGLGVNAQPVDTVAMPAGSRQSAGGYVLDGLAQGLAAMSKQYQGYAQTRTEQFAKSEQERAFQVSLEDNFATPVFNGDESVFFQEARSQIFREKTAADTVTALNAEYSAMLENEEFLASGNAGEVAAKLYKDHYSQVSDPKLAQMLYGQVQKTNSDFVTAATKAQKKYRVEATRTATSDAVGSILASANGKPVAEQQAAADRAFQLAAPLVGAAGALQMVGEKVNSFIATNNQLGWEFAMGGGEYEGTTYSAWKPGGKELTQYQEKEGSQFLSTIATGVNAARTRRESQVKEAFALEKEEAALKDKQYYSNLNARLDQGEMPTAAELSWAANRGVVDDVLRRAKAAQVTADVKTTVDPLIATHGANKIRWAGQGYSDKDIQDSVTRQMTPFTRALEEATDFNKAADASVAYLNEFRKHDQNAEPEELQKLLSGAVNDPVPAPGQPASRRQLVGVAVVDAALKGANPEETLKRLFPSEDDREHLKSVQRYVRERGMAPTEAFVRAAADRERTKERKDWVHANRPKLASALRNQANNVLTGHDLSPGAIGTLEQSFVRWSERNGLDIGVPDDLATQFLQSYVADNYVAVPDVIRESKPLADSFGGYVKDVVTLQYAKDVWDMAKVAWGDDSLIRKPTEQASGMSSSEITRNWPIITTFVRGAVGARYKGEASIASDGVLPDTYVFTVKTGNDKSLEYRLSTQEMVELYKTLGASDSSRSVSRVAVESRSKLEATVVERLKAQEAEAKRINGLGKAVPKDQGYIPEAALVPATSKTKSFNLPPPVPLPVPGDLPTRPQLKQGVTLPQGIVNGPPAGMPPLVSPKSN